MKSLPILHIIGRWSYYKTYLEYKNRLDDVYKYKMRMKRPIKERSGLIILRNIFLQGPFKIPVVNIGFGVAPPARELTKAVKLLYEAFTLPPEKPVEKEKTVDEKPEERVEKPEKPVDEEGQGEKEGTSADDVAAAADSTTAATRKKNNNYPTTKREKKFRALLEEAFDLLLVACWPGVTRNALMRWESFFMSKSATPLPFNAIRLEVVYGKFPHFIHPYVNEPIFRN